MYADFNRFSIKLTKEQALQGSHQGSVDDDIKDLLTIPAIKAQFNKIAPEDIQAELKEYGAWDDDELSSDDKNKSRILWIACGNIRDDIAEKRSK